MGRLQKLGIVLATVAAGLTATAATAIAAPVGTAVTAAPAHVLSDPPGLCNPEEKGTVKVGPDGYLWECTYVPDNGGTYYWLPV